MKSENGKIEDRTILDEDLQLAGLWVGDCRVTNGARLELLGTVTGSVIVDEGSTALIAGMVNGDVVANGRVEITGTVSGRVTGSGL
ncbi:polymer-forming cytoskeletal protein [Tsukamurella sp. 8F]|uniref:polymer-forming cytoskeletal protein n=1 Tax=unclassified Tsukamurella TaxID=2633480 RepID=UPI0023B9CC9F|nr:MULTISPECIES: polymer-forming cytoskeletal protein [unclassified Tsukamurella]MDF0532276.1 polymer-forming cytoskeletal protein [Tsukamurella sp. 8J]MDF0589302.1 polymer-forming cytoskeletal protein [Tsukamurella sp. 8F]